MTVEYSLSRKSSITQQAYIRNDYSPVIQTIMSISQEKK